MGARRIRRDAARGHLASRVVVRKELGVELWRALTREAVHFCHHRRQGPSRLQTKAPAPAAVEEEEEGQPPVVEPKAEAQACSTGGERTNRQRCEDPGF